MIPDPPEGEDWRWFLRYTWDDATVRCLVYLALVVIACWILTASLSS